MTDINVVIYNVPGYELEEPLRRRQIEEQVNAARLIDAHRRGEHPWGSMRRDCPLCQREG